MTQRDIDDRAEQQLAKFLDTHLYQELLKEENFISFKRVADSRLQKQGVDVIAKTEHAVANIDEKAQLHYINDNRPTFVFELEFIRAGQAMEGWFLNERLQTTHYLLLWPNAKTADLSQIVSDDFTCVEGMMISKNKLKKYLNEIGISINFLRQTTKLLREQGVSGSQKTAYAGIKFYVSPSSKYSENPINMVISKQILEQLADAHYMISQQGFIRLNQKA